MEITELQDEKLMSHPPIVSREEWQRARDQLLVKEKAATRARDALAAERRRLPMFRIEKNYVFEGPEGKASLLDLFAGRRQLIIYHFMFAPDVDGWPSAGCPGCSMVVDHLGPVGTCTLVTLRSSLSHARRWQISSHTNGGWDGVFHGFPRQARISMTISASRLLRARPLDSASSCERRVLFSRLTSPMPEASSRCQQLRPARPDAVRTARAMGGFPRRMAADSALRVVASS